MVVADRLGSICGRWVTITLLLTCYLIGVLIYVIVNDVYVVTVPILLLSVPCIISLWRYSIYLIKVTDFVSCVYTTRNLKVWHDVEKGKVFVSNGDYRNVRLLCVEEVIQDETDNNKLIWDIYECKLYVPWDIPFEDLKK